MDNTTAGSIYNRTLPRLLFPVHVQKKKKLLMTFGTTPVCNPEVSRPDRPWDAVYSGAETCSRHIYRELYFTFNDLYLIAFYFVYLLVNMLNI